MKTYTMKFGGTSVGSSEAIANVVRIVGSKVREGHRVAVIVSAMASVTDSLLESVRLAAQGDRWGYTSLSQNIRDRHEQAIGRGCIDHVAGVQRCQVQKLVIMSLTD